MTQAEFRKELKSGLSGTYLFYGDEEYLKKFYAGRAQTHTVGDDGDLSEWNTHIITADKDPQLGELEGATLAVSMMGDRTFVRYNADLTSFTSDETDRLIDIIESIDPDSTVLLIVTPPEGFDPGKPKKPSQMFKRFDSVCKLVDLSCETPAELKKWMARRLSQDSLAITSDAAELLLVRATDNMFILSGELDKLSAQSGKKYYLTTALPTTAWVFDITELDRSHVYLDYVNVMTYDIYSERKITSSHSAPLPTSRAPFPCASLEENIKLFIVELHSATAHSREIKKLFYHIIKS